MSWRFFKNYLEIKVWSQKISSPEKKTVAKIFSIKFGFGRKYLYWKFSTLRYTTLIPFSPYLLSETFELSHSRAHCQHYTSILCTGCILQNLGRTLPCQTWCGRTWFRPLLTEIWRRVYLQLCPPHPQLKEKLTSWCFDVILCYPESIERTAFWGLSSKCSTSRMFNS